MGLVLQLVETQVDRRTRRVEVMEISRPSDLHDIANLGLTLPEAKQLLARVQQAVAAAQARDHAALRPDWALPRTARRPLRSVWVHFFGRFGGIKLSWWR